MAGRIFLSGIGQNINGGNLSSWKMMQALPGWQSPCSGTGVDAHAYSISPQAAASAADGSSTARSIADRASAPPKSDICGYLIRKADNLQSWNRSVRAGR